MNTLAEAIPNTIPFDSVRNEINAENNLVCIAAVFNPTGAIKFLNDEFSFGKKYLLFIEYDKGYVDPQLNF